VVLTLRRAARPDIPLARVRRGVPDIDVIFRAGAPCTVRASKEKNMKLTLWLGVLAFAAAPVFAQAPAGQTGKIHGHVINPTGAAQTSGVISLSTDGGKTAKYSFEVDPTGSYSGEAAPGTYMLVFRQKDTPPDKMVDSIPDVKIAAGQDLNLDDDMSRQAYVDKLPEDQKKQLEELRKHTPKP
jgi:hypothetical protein